MNAADPTMTDQMRAALDWWQLAGVDSDFCDDATDWLGESISANGASASQSEAETTSFAGKAQAQERQEVAPKVSAKPVERIDLLGTNPPNTLIEFHEWWLSAPGLDAIGPRGRIPPRGTESAELMVLVTDPEQGDSDKLLSGPQGRLLKRIIAAIGLPEEKVYFASALPRHTPLADTAAIAASGMDEVTKLHVSLVGPRQVLAFGAGIPPLLGHGPTNDLSLLREINQTTSSIPLFVTEGLDAMMAMPRLKARFWRRWIEWSVKG